MAITTYTIATQGPSTYRGASNVIGVPGLSGIYTAGTLGAPGISSILPSVPVEYLVGSRIRGQLQDATYGGESEFILLAVPTSTTTTAGLMYKYDGAYSIAVVATAVSASGQSGIPIALAINSVTSNATSIQYTWFQVQGRGVALKSVSITAQPSVPLFVSGATAGRVRTTSSAFRAIIGARSANVATATGSILPIMLMYPSITAGS